VAKICKLFAKLVKTAKKIEKSLFLAGFFPFNADLFVSD
jgi:hypothetical protein